MFGTASRTHDIDFQATTFFALSDALALDQEEERAMLGLRPQDLQRLHTSPAEAMQWGGPKLVRRLDYAIPLLKRMLASIAS